MTKDELIKIIDSWENLPLTIELIGKNAEHFNLLMDLALYSKHKNSWRAAYIADRIHDDHPDKLLPFIEKLILQLEKEEHHGKKRHFLKLISMNKIPKKYYGFLVDYCLNAVSSAKEAPAVRVHAMQILYNISESEPDLKPELLSIIEHEMEYHSTPGIISRGTKLTKKLRAQIKN